MDFTAFVGLITGAILGVGFSRAKKYLKRKLWHMHSADKTAPCR